MYQGHQAPYLQTLTGYLHHSPLPALPPSNLPTSNVHQHFQTNNTNGGDANDSDAAGAMSASSSAILLFESRQTNRDLRLQLTDALLKLDRLLAKVDEIGSERSSDVVLRNSSSLSANASGFESGPFKSSYFQLTRENDELKSRLSEMTIKLQSQQDNISRLLDNNQKLLEQNVDLMGRSFDSPGNQSNQATSQQAILAMNSFGAGASEELDALKVELASMRTRETECQRQIEKLIRMDQENKLQLQQTDLQLKDWSQTMDRLNAELNEEKKRRKEAEMTSRALATDAEDNKTKNAALTKTLSDLKTSSKSKITELENDVKSLQDNHQKEMSLVKERFRKDKSRVQEDHSEMLRQTEESLKSSWKRKYENLEKTLKDRHSLQLDELSTEKSFLVDRVASLEQKMAELKSQRTAEESSRAALLSEMEENKTWKAKYDNLRAQAISMKDRYTQQVSGLEEESSLLEEKYNRMTDKYYKAEESLSIATQKYEEFKVRSLDGRREFDAKVHQLESELVSTKSELEEALRRGVQTQLELEEAKNKYLRLAERTEALEKEQERENSHVAQTTLAPLARTERTKSHGDAVPLCSPHEDAKELLLTPLGGASNSYKYKPMIEKQEHEPEHEEQEEELEKEQEERPEVREPEEEDDDDDGDSFVTALSDDDDVWCIDRETKDVTCSDESLPSAYSRMSVSDDLGNDQCVIDSHLDLRNDARTTSAVDLDIARNSLQEQDSGTTINTGDLEEANRESQTDDLDIQRSSKFANDIDKSNGLEVHFDLNPEKDLERTEVTTKRNESDLTLPHKMTGTSCDLSSSESTAMNLHSPMAPDLSGDALKEIKDLDLGVVLDSISEQRASENLQPKTHVSPPATEAIPTAATLSQNSKSEAPSHENPITAGASITNQNGGFEHELRTAGKLENTGDNEFPSQSKAESGQQEPTCSPSSKDKNCDRETVAECFDHEENTWTAGKQENIEADNRSESRSEFLRSASSAESKDENCDEETSVEGFEQKKHGGKSGKLESTEDEELTSHLGNESEREPTSPDIDKDGNCDEEISDLGILDENYNEQETEEDATYIVTSGGRIVFECVKESDGEVVAKGGWSVEREGGQGVDDTQTLKNSQSPSSKNDPFDVERTSFNGLDDTKSKEQTETSNGSLEDSVYTVTSGGQIVSGWTDNEDPAPGGASHTTPEVDQPHLVGRTTDLDVIEVPEESSSAFGITDAPEASSNQPEEGSGTWEVVEVGIEALPRKQEDPVSRFGACVILREEDIEKMWETRRNDSLSGQKEKKKKEKKKKTG